MDSTQGIMGTRTFGWDLSWHQGLIQDSNSGFRNDGLAAVLANCLSGVGDTMIPLLASLVTMWRLQLPLAAFLPRVADLGVYGVRWAMVIALAMRACTYIFYFRLGRWKSKNCSTSRTVGGFGWESTTRMTKEPRQRQAQKFCLLSPQPHHR